MKVTLYMAISLNGIIARENGDEDFLSHENWNDFISLAKEKGNFIYGRKTYEAVRKWGDEYLKDLASIPTMVCVSENSTGKVENGFEFVSSPKEALDLLSRKGYTEALLTGGATNNSAFASEGLIDEVLLNVEPCIVGKGIAVFKPDDFNIKLAFVESKTSPSGIVRLHYQVVKEGNFGI